MQGASRAVGQGLARAALVQVLANHQLQVRPSTQFNPAHLDKLKPACLQVHKYLSAVLNAGDALAGFGQVSTPGFGTPSAPGFGAPASPGFGAPATPGGLALQILP